MSILDGWWDEAYQPGIGWAFGKGKEIEYDDIQQQYEVEANVLYNLIEQEVAPLFYDRGEGGMPRRWIQYMKASMRAICPAFNTIRMMHEYTTRFYQPASARYQLLIEDGAQRAREIVEWKTDLREKWSQIRIEHAFANMSGEMKVGTPLEVQADVYLGAISPESVDVQAYIARLDKDGQMLPGDAISLGQQEAKGNGLYSFAGNIPCRSAGRHGCALRVLPKHESLSNPYEPGLILWSD